MNLKFLVSEQIKNTLNNNTNCIIQNLSNSFNIDKYILINIWNKLNSDFKVSVEVLDEDILQVEVLDEDIHQEHVIEIIDEEF